MLTRQRQRYAGQEARIGVRIRRVFQGGPVARLIVLILLSATAFMRVPARAVANDLYLKYPSSQPIAVCGFQVEDPFHLMEWGTDYEKKKEAGDDIKGWAADRYTEAKEYLHALPMYKEVLAQIKDLHAGEIRYDNVTSASSFLFATRLEPDLKDIKRKPVLIRWDSGGDPRNAVTVLDPNEHNLEIKKFVPSHDGKKVAAFITQKGLTTLDIIEISSGLTLERLLDVNSDALGADVAWNANDAGVWYVRYPGDEKPEEDRPFYPWVEYRQLGTGKSTDHIVLNNLAIAAGVRRTAEITFDNGQESHTLVIRVQDGDGGEAEYWVLRESTSIPERIATFDDNVAAATAGPDGSIYLLSYKDSPHGRLLRLSPGAQAPAELVPQQGQGAIAVGDQAQFVATSKHIFVRYLIGGPSEVRIFDLSGHQVGTLPVLHDIAKAGDLLSVGDDILYSVETYTQPKVVWRYQEATGRATATSLANSSPATAPKVTVIRSDATSRDGTVVPFTLVLPDGYRWGQVRPLLLAGYGAYGISLEPQFLSARERLWLQNGGIYAEANIRGGGEFGQKWHHDGWRENKQNTFEDFHAVAQALIDRGYTTPSSLALVGRSAGGLLMGAMITQWPDLERAVLSSNGVYDALRMEHEQPNGPSNVREFGSVNDPKQCNALLAYSPYHNVKANNSYPAVLLTTGFKDDSVLPWQSFKFFERLRQVQPKALPGQVLLRVTPEGGHDSTDSEPPDRRINREADQLTFLFDALGAESAAATCASMPAEGPALARDRISAFQRTFEEAWNNGDLDRVMESYWAGEWRGHRLLYFGDPVWIDWNGLRKRWWDHYFSIGIYGILRLDLEKIELRSENAALMSGKYHLQPKGAPEGSGSTTVVICQTPDGLKIVYDRT